MRNGGELSGISVPVHSTGPLSVRHLLFAITQPHASPNPYPQAYASWPRHSSFPSSICLLLLADRRAALLFHPVRGFHVRARRSPAWLSSCTAGSLPSVSLIGGPSSYITRRRNPIVVRLEIPACSLVGWWRSQIDSTASSTLHVRRSTARPTGHTERA